MNTNNLTIMVLLYNFTSADTKFCKLHAKISMFIQYTVTVKYKNSGSIVVSCPDPSHLT